MNNTVELILNNLKNCDDFHNRCDYLLEHDEITYLLEYIKQLKKENNDLRRIYQNTYKKYLENGNEEMAHYFMAQIDACPTFYVEPVIDYYKEYYKLENSRKKVIESINKKMGNKDFDYIKFSMDEIVYLLNTLMKGSD